MDIEKLISLGYEVNTFGQTEIVTRRINNISVNIAYYYNNILTLIADNNLELIKQFIIDMDIKPSCYNLHIIRQNYYGDLANNACHVNYLN